MYLSDILSKKVNIEEKRLIFSNSQNFSSFIKLRCDE